MNTSDKLPPIVERPVREHEASSVEAQPVAQSERVNAPNEPPLPLAGNVPDKLGSRLLDAALALVAWVASIFLLLLMSVVFVMPYAFRHTGMNQESLTRFLTTDKTAIFLQILSTIPAHLLTLCVVWAVVTYFGRRPFWSTLNWSWSPRFGSLESVVFILLGLSLFFLGWLITLKFHGGETQVDKIINSSDASRYTIALLATFTAPLVEEMVYRGVIYSALERITGTWLAVAGVLLLFTIIHVPQYWPNFAAIAVIAILSLVLTIVRASTGRLLPCFIIHLVFNGIQSIIIILEPYIPHLNSGDEQKAASFIMLAQAVHRLL